jgi:hypothetical protein
MLVTASGTGSLVRCPARQKVRIPGQPTRGHDLSCRFREKGPAIQDFSKGSWMGKIVNYGDFRKT